ncbi:MAG: metal ABC transporter permease [Candidatus Methanomethylophilaceae archaeon]
MSDWISMLSMPLIQNMFIATTVACVLCGVIGTYVVVKQMVSVTGGIAHTMFGGIGLAYYLESVLLVSWFTPMDGALLFAVISALVLSIPTISRRLGQDSVIGVLWAAGMAIGVIFMNLVDYSVVTPRSYESILFGDVLLVGQTDILLMVTVTVAISAIVLWFYRDLQLLTFDETHAKLTGINVNLMKTLLYLMVAITCVMITNIVGIVLIIALMTIPAAMANLFSSSLGEMMLSSIVLSIVFSLLGLILAINFDLPPGGTVTITITVAFLIAFVAKNLSERHGKRTCTATKKIEKIR